MKDTLKGVFVAFLLLFSSFFGSLIFMAPMLPLVYFKTTEVLGRYIMDRLIFKWKFLAVTLCELVLGIKIVIKGDEVLTPHESQLIIMNHRTRIDWLFFMSYQIRFGSLVSYVISLKNPLKYIPGAGWAMQCGAFLFLQRKWELDKSWITNCIKYFSRVNHKPQLLLFPEGTDFCANGKRKSDAFAEKNGLQKYEYVLHPRTTGFIHLLTEMRQNECVDSIIDVTVAYPKHILHNETDLITGKCPEEIHFLIHRYKTDDIPKDAEGMEEWCKKIFAEKEKRLGSYYEKKEFDSSEKLLQTNEESLQFNMKLCLIYWLLFCAIVLYCIIFVNYFITYCIVTSLAFLIIIEINGGVDNLLFLPQPSQTRSH